MKRKSILRSSTLFVATAILLASTGCSNYTGEDVSKYPLTSMVTQQELIDYYAKSLDYDAVISKNVNVHRTEYELKEVNGAKAEKLKELLYKAEEILGEQEYKVDDKTSKLVSKDTYNYIKAAVDGLVLDNGEVTNIQGALGYYFVDVKYEISPQEQGEFKEVVDMLGLNGTWVPSATGEHEMDFAYIITAVTKLNDYFANNMINKKASYDEDTGLISIDEEDAEDDTNYKPDYSFDEDDDSTDSDEDTDDEEDDKTNRARYNEYDTDYHIGFNSVVPNYRKVLLDVNLINRVVGSSTTQSSYLPSLDLVFDVAKESGTISGYGIYPEGSNGLKIFGFNREDLAGTLTLRYVFKDSIDGSGEIIGTNIYIAEQEINNGFNVTSNNVAIPEFLMKEFEILVERADRAQANCDLSGLMNGMIYEDKGYAVLRGYKSIYTNQSKHMSKIRQVIARDTTNNAYLLEVETTVVEGAKDVDTSGTYTDRYYMVIQQQGNVFVISDTIKISREISTEPSIDADSATAKRLVALNLSGDISDENKEDIKKLISSLYTAGTNRVLNGPKEITVKGEKVTIEKGMYDCFNNDVSMLSSMDKEYMNSKLRGVLIKYGANTKSVYSGTVTEWIGGYDNQAEFITEELVTYTGMDEGHYTQVYYLVSKMNDEWVIDERTVIDEYVVEGSELSNIKDRVGQ